MRVVLLKGQVDNYMFYLQVKVDGWDPTISVFMAQSMIRFQFADKGFYDAINN